MNTGRSQHPPKPYLVVRVGVTGHRPKALQEAGANKAILQNTICTVLVRIRNEAYKIFKSNKDVYAGDRPILRLISPLAEGSDRLVAQIAQDLRYEIQCPLPFGQSDYETTFTDTNNQAKSIAEFYKLLPKDKVLVLDGRKEEAAKAYEAVGHVVLRQSDILISIWDGKPPEPGGTGQITQEALKRQIPTIWIPVGQADSAFLLKNVLESGAAGESGNLANEDLPKRLV